jgi:RNA polymerase sigma-70 factor, ECF subfamily
MNATAVLPLGRQQPTIGVTPRLTNRPERLIRHLYETHAPALLAFVTRLTSGDRQWAEDVVQETLLRAWRSSVSVDEAQPPVRSWLFTVARRIVIDARRSRAARPAEVGDEALAYVSEGDQIENMLSALTVSEALASLSADHRAVLQEIYFRGSKIDEAAKTLGVSAGTVKSRTHYALKSLRLALEERGLDADR